MCLISQGPLLTQPYELIERLVELLDCLLASFHPLAHFIDVCMCVVCSVLDSWRLWTSSCHHLLQSYRAAVRVIYYTFIIAVKAVSAPRVKYQDITQLRMCLALIGTF